MSQDLPEIDNAPWWEAVARRELTYQFCAGCERAVFYPRSRCPHCFSAKLEWRKSSGNGSIYALTVVRRAPRGFESRVPYIVALVELEEGFRLMTHIVGCTLQEARVGMAVCVDFEAIGGEKLLPVFRPAKSEKAASAADGKAG